MSSTLNYVFALVGAVLTLSILSGIVYHVCPNHTGQWSYKTPEADDIVTTLSVGPWARLTSSSSGLELTAKERFTDSKLPVRGYLGRKKSGHNMVNCKNKKDGLCFNRKDGFRLEVFSSAIKRKPIRKVKDLDCITISWEPPANSSIKETPEDCFDLSGFHWFGGFEESCQTWPMNGYNINSSAFITADSYMGRVFGSVIEGIFLSSSGLGIIVEETTPLYVSINQGGLPHLCLKGKVGEGTPFFNVTKPFLQYDVCLSANVLTLWQGISARHIPTPAFAPSFEVIKRPIWCTWAVYYDKINQSIILDYAKSIRAHNLSVSQLEIDDSWTLHYGDFNFTTDRFPDAAQMIQNLTDLGIPATVWVHPFFNKDSKTYQLLKEKGFLVKDIDSDNPHSVSWWRSKNESGILDVTNPDAVQWYLDTLNYLKVTFNVTSFKFDAGEAIWYPGKYKVQNPVASPNYLSSKYIDLALRSDMNQKRQEMRVGFRSQKSSLMMRIIDRESDWSHTLGIKTVIPASLVFGMMGYPYILPDMVGGDGSPDKELFIRWLQVSTFLPVIQISNPPWRFGDDVVQLTRKFLQLHEDYADDIFDLALNAIKTGEPIIRPLWWIAPQDEDALPIDTEFLLGNNLLVAPVLEWGARSRDIYLPSGQWRDENTGEIVQGGVWLLNYAVPLEVLPYFTKIA
ncbi:myogenesis-regulating glycosidase-like isoform X3 [Biomphalaria glabrata]|nr:myogenesis-regulating glycosidase-like isoform X3 [Biomphalaria glabrata]XP_055863829.1 myogenesis-regulating glycosidase-like isoform X3 [Biomphalaria glabrata]XP_055863830.1 myogenesis-regulating glycosidase-like isoform X3 [Biomphalaria glabrata]XP_055863831.1 myogenesis-regulating glycosidase-like isoform X3 [Biomphalaria glabrata]